MMAIVILGGMTWEPEETSAGSGPPPPPVISSAAGSVDQIIKASYDPVRVAMRVMVVGTSGSPQKTKLDAEQIWKIVYDVTTNSIRVAVTPGDNGPGKKLDYRQIMQDIYDPTLQALRIDLSPPPFPSSGSLDTEQIIRRIYSGSDHSLRATDTGSLSASSGTSLDWAQVIQKEFDRTITALKIVN